MSPTTTTTSSAVSVLSEMLTKLLSDLHSTIPSTASPGASLLLDPVALIQDMSDLLILHLDHHHPSTTTTTSSSSGMGAVGFPLCSALLFDTGGHHQHSSSSSSGHGSHSGGLLSFLSRSMGLSHTAASTLAPSSTTTTSATSISTRSKALARARRAALDLIDQYIKMAASSAETAPPPASDTRTAATMTATASRGRSTALATPPPMSADQTRSVLRHCVDVFRREAVRGSGSAQTGGNSAVRLAALAPIMRIITCSGGVITGPPLPEARSLFDMLLAEIMRSQKSSVPSSLRGAIYRTLAVISEHYPHLDTQGEHGSGGTGERALHRNRTETLRRILLDTMREQSSASSAGGSKGEDMVLITDTLRAMSHFLICNTLDEGQHSNNRNGGGVRTAPATPVVQMVYRFMCRALELTDSSRHDVCKSSLHFLSRHANHFKEYLTVDAEKMMARMEKLCTHRNDKVRAGAFPALEAFLAQVASELVHSSRDIQSNVRTFRALMSRFNLLLDPRSSSRYELSMAIRAYGCFASPIRKYLGEEDTKHLLMKLFQFSDQLLTRSQEELDEYVHHIPNFIAAFASIILEMDDGSALDIWILDHLERIVGILFLLFPRQFAFYRFRASCYTAMMKLLLTLYLKGDSLNLFLSRIVFQGLAISLSGSTPASSSSSSSSDNSADGYSNSNARNSIAPSSESPDYPSTAPTASTHSYREHLDLWMYMLNPQTIQLQKWDAPWSDLVLSEDIVAHMHSLVYDKMVEVVMDMLSKLDLSTCRIDDQNVPVTARTNDRSESALAEAQLEDLSPADVDTERQRPNNPKDFRIYLNLVEFARAFLSKCQTSHFVRWNFVFCKLMIERAHKFPYVSGFYKLLEAAMTICDTYHYFEECASGGSDDVAETEQQKVSHVLVAKEEENSDREKGSDEMEDEDHPPAAILIPHESVGDYLTNLLTVDHSTRELTFRMLLKFCNDAIARMHEYKGELLASCLRFVLSMPREFIVNNAQQFVMALCQAFEMGVNYLPLSNVALDALEYWMRVLKDEQIKAAGIIHAVFPVLTMYLVVSGTEDETMTSHLGSTGVFKNRYGINKNAIDTERRRKKLAASMLSAADKTSLREVQVRIIRFLAGLGGQNTLILRGLFEDALDTGTSIPGSSKEDSDMRAPSLKKTAIAWDSTPRVRFSLPFRDVKPDIFLDSVLPRVVELAENSGERQTKIAACELLHSMVLFMVGRNAVSPQARARQQQQQQQQQQQGQGKTSSQQKNSEKETNTSQNEATPFFNIYRRIFPVLLQLAVDTEQIARQLFEPLVFQLTRWFTQNIRFENKETMALLDSIVDGVCNPRDGALRGLCANLLNEFVKWSVKHDTQSTVTSSLSLPLRRYRNISSLFQRLYSRLHHPNLHRRLGAITSFLRMYRTLREVDELIDIHAMDWLHNVVMSMRLSSSSNANRAADMSIIDKTRDLLNHIVKIITYRRELLQRENVLRTVHISLDDAVQWVFDQCGSNNLLMRHECMRLFPLLCMQLHNFHTMDGPRRWLSARMQKEGTTSVLRIVEQFLGGEPGHELSSNSSSSSSSTASLETATTRESKTDPSPTLMENAVQWLAELDASLDCMIWLFGTQQLLVPHQIFTTNPARHTAQTRSKRARREDTSDSDFDAADMEIDDGETYERVSSTSRKRTRVKTESHEASDNGPASFSSLLLTHIETFLNRYAMLSRGNSRTRDDRKQVADENHFAEKKCTVVLRLLQFLALMLEKYPASITPWNAVLGHSLLQLLFRCMLDPAQIGFVTSEEESQTTLPRICNRLCTALLAYGTNYPQNNTRERMLQVLKEILVQDSLHHEESFQTSNKLNLLNFDIVSCRRAVDDITFLFRGYQLLHHLGLLEDCLSSTEVGATSPQELALHIGEKQLFNLGRTLQPNQSIIAQEAWCMCVALGFPVKKLVEMLTDQRPANSTGNVAHNIRIDDHESAAPVNQSSLRSATMPSKGEVFYKRFQPEIDSFVASHMSESIQLLLTHHMSSASRSEEHDVLSIVLLINVADRFARKKSLKKEESQGFIREVMESLDASLDKCLESNEGSKGDGNDTGIKSVAHHDFVLHMMKLFERCLRLDSNTLLDPSHRNFDKLKQFFLQCIRSKKDAAHSSLDLKHRSIASVPYFLSVDHMRDDVITEVGKVVINDMPLNFIELKKDSSQYDDHLMLMEELLLLLQGTANVALLQQLLPLYRWRDHPLRDKMATALRILFHKLGSQRMLQAASACIDAFFDETLPIDMRISCIQWVCLSCIQQMSQTVLLQFFEQSISRITHPLMGEIKFDIASFASENDLRASYVTVICCFNLLEAMFRLLSAAEIKNQLNQTYVASLGPGTQATPTGKELTERVMRTAFSARSHRPTQTERQAAGMKLIHDLHCSAYNTLASAVRTTQTQEKFFTSFLFREKTSGDLWNNIVDTSKKLNDFPIETNFVMYRRAVDELRSESETMKTMKKSSPSSSTSSSSSSSSSSLLAVTAKENVGTQRERGTGYHLQYLSSQYLADSSLSADAGSSALATSFFIPGSRYGTQSASASLSHENAGDGTSDVNLLASQSGEVYTKENVTASHLYEHGDEIMVFNVSERSEALHDDVDLLEMDDINANVCMIVMLRIIDHMTKTFSSKPGTMPAWMGEIHRKFSDDSTHINVRIFLAKILVNRPTIFEPYALQWCIPLMYFIVSRDLSTGGGLNYFIRDLCVLLLRWKDLALPDTDEYRKAASDLVAFVMKRCAHERRMILKANLELVKLLVERFKDHITLNKDVILGWICYDVRRQQRAKLARTTGLQLLAVLLANDLPVYDHRHDAQMISETQYFQRVVDNLNIPHKEVYEAAAEVAGMVLVSLTLEKDRRMTRGDGNASSQSSLQSFSLSSALSDLDSSSSFEKFEKLLTATVGSFLTRREYDRFLNCLNKIAIHYPPFLDRYLPTKIVDLLPNLYGQYKRMALQLVYWRAAQTKDLYTSLKPFLRELLQHREETTQILTLKIVYKLLKTMNTEEVIHLLGLIDRDIYKNDRIFHATFGELCRSAFYDIMIWIYDNRPDVRNLIVERITLSLLRGMGDASDDIRKKLLEFWDHESRLSADSLRRLEQLFTKLYSSNLGVHEQWLKFSGYLMLQLCHRSPDFDSKTSIFAESLANCEFREYFIDPSWQSRGTSMTPLFSHTASSTMNLSLDPQAFGARQTSNNSGENGRHQQQQQQQHQIGMIPATNAPQFSVTQNTAYSSNVMSVLSDPSLSQTSLLFKPFKRRTITTQDQTVDPVSTSGPNSSTSIQYQQQQQQQQQDQALPSLDNMRLRRRFFKMKETTLTQQHIKRAMRLKRKRDEWDACNQIERKNRVVMYRTYRTGELPDIQIAIREIVVPLQALCLIDATVARHIFVPLFGSLYSEIEERMPLPEARPLKKNIHSHISKMIPQAKHCPLLVSALFSICLAEPDDFLRPKIINARTVSEVGMESYNAEQAILVLEKLLMRRLMPHTEELERKRHRRQRIQQSPAASATSGTKSISSATRTASVTLLDDDDNIGDMADAVEAESNDNEEEKILTAEQIRDILTETWTELAKLYNSLHEEDVVLAIFENLVARSQHSKQGLQLELNGQLAEASKEYEKAYHEWMAQEEQQQKHGQATDMLITQYEAEFVQAEKLECLRKLNRWDHISKQLQHVNNDKMENVWHIDNPQRMLSLLLQSHMKRPTSSEEEAVEQWTRLNEFIEESMEHHQDRKYLLESKFSTDLAILSMLCGEHEKARNRVMTSYGMFIDNWSALSPLAIGAREALVRNLPKLLEVEEYANLMSKVLLRHDDISHIESIFHGLMHVWKRRYPSSRFDDMSVWDDIVQNRRQMLLRLETHVLDQYGQDTERVAAFSCAIHEQLEKLYTAATLAAIEQESFSVAQAYLKKSKEHHERVASGTTSFHFVTSLATLLMMKGKRSGDVETMAKSSAYLRNNEHEVGDTAEKRMEVLLLRGNIESEFATLLHMHPNPKYSRENKLMEAFGAYTEAEQCARQQHLTDSSPIRDDHLAASIYVQLGAFADNLIRVRQLQQQEEEEESDGEDDVDDEDDGHGDQSMASYAKEGHLSMQTLSVTMVRCYLSAMALHHRHARDRFPRLLEVIEQNEGTHTQFSVQVRKIPNWMFLQWIGQILPALNGASAPYLTDILLSIADEYPQALYFPFNISQEDIHPRQESVRQAMDSLRRKLHSEVLKTFVTHMFKMTHPHLRLKDALDELLLLLKEKQSGGDTVWRDNIVKHWHLLFDDICDYSNREAGPYNRNFSRAVSAEIKKLLGGRSSPKILTMRLSDFDKIRRALVDMVNKKWYARVGDPSSLADLSKWLADYQHSADHRQWIEIPGRYTALGGPPEEYQHRAIVSSFDPSIMTMSSIRKPKRLVMRGNDEREYAFLVKGGEDLRQDQRIEEMFDLMNATLRADPSCAKRRLQVKTYRVVPMSKSVGVLEWVDNTRPLKSFIESEATRRRGQTTRLLQHPAVNVYMGMVNKIKGKSLAEQIVKSFQTCDRDTVTTMMHKSYREIDPDMIKAGIVRLASSPEAFFMMRNHLARSLATLSMCSYVLGIGDRHLDNFLLDCSDGDIVAIDFGHAFGSATEVLPLPELMPFRLTRQLVHIFAPMVVPFDDETHGGNTTTDSTAAGPALSEYNSFRGLQVGTGGLLMETMVHAMKALHMNRESLLCTMDVFVKEPLVDWLKFAAKQEAKMLHTKEDNNGDDDGESNGPRNKHSWYPKLKMSIARKKLEMHNPAHLVWKDLKRNANIPPSLRDRYMRPVVFGDRKHNARARAAEKCSSIRQQVECLVDMATDGNILGRTWLGWAPQF